MLFQSFARFFLPSAAAAFMSERGALTFMSERVAPLAAPEFPGIPRATWGSPGARGEVLQGMNISFLDTRAISGVHV